MLLPALPGEVEQDLLLADVDVLGSHRREPERLVVGGVPVVADPDERLVEQPDDEGEDLLPTEAAAVEVGVEPSPELGQGGADEPS